MERLESRTHHGSLQGADVGGGVLVEGVEEDGRGHRRGLRAELLERARADGGRLEDEVRELLELLEFGPSRYDVGGVLAGLDALEIGGFARLDVIRLSLRDASLAGARLVSPKRTKPGSIRAGRTKASGEGLFTRHEKATTDRRGFGAVSGAHRDAEAGERAHGERIHDVRSLIACVTCVSARKCVDAPDPPSRIKRRNRKYLESDVD